MGSKFEGLWVVMREVPPSMLIYIIVLFLLLCVIMPPAIVHEHRICLYLLYIAIMYIMIQIYIYSEHEMANSVTRGVRGGEL